MKDTQKTPVHKVINFRTFQDVMVYLLGGQDPIVTKADGGIEWIADKLGKARSTTYGYYEGRGEPSVSEARNLHNALLREKGCYVILSFFEYRNKGN